MIRLIDIRLNAAHPELPLAEAVTYTGAPSTMLIRGVPGNCGKWCITSVYVAATFPDGSTSTRLAVQSANGVWVATLPATNTSGRTANGVRIMADGEDENGELVTGYVLGVADFAVASLGVAPAPEPGATSWQMLYFDTVPGVLRKGDVTKIDGVLSIYNGTTWEAFDARAAAAAAAAQNAISTHAADSTIHVTAADKVAWNGKQDALTGQQLANIAAVPDKLDKSNGGIVTGPVLFNSANPIVGPLTLGFNINPEHVENALDIIRASDGDFYLRIRDTTLADMVQQKLPRTSGTYALLSDISTAIQQIAPAWVSGTAYAANKLCSYNGVAYQNTSGATIQSATTPDTSGSGWTAKPVSDLFLPLTGGTMTGQLTVDGSILVQNETGDGTVTALSYALQSGIALLRDANARLVFQKDNVFTLIIPQTNGTLALAASNPTAGNLAALDASGNPTDSGIKASDKLDSTSAAPAFSTSSTYAVDEHCTYNGKLYRCTTAVTTAGAWTGLTNWTAEDMTTPDATLDVTATDKLLRLVATNGDVIWGQGYNLSTESSATVLTEQVSAFTFAADAVADQAIVLPTVAAGKVGDFILDVTNLSANDRSLTLTGLDSAFSVVVKAGDDLSETLTVAAGEMARYYLTLTAFRVNSLPTWQVAKEAVENGGAQS